MIDSKLFMKKSLSILIVLILCLIFISCNEDICTQTDEMITQTTSTKETMIPLTTETSSASTEREYDYVLNTNSMKFHYPNCNAAQKISDRNKKEYHGTRELVIQEGYDSCGICHP